MKTAAQVREMLRASAPGITFRREESGEFRVTFTQAAIAAAFPELSRAELIAKAESLAAYESDADSVLETGLAMARTGLRDFGAELAERRAMETAALDPARRDNVEYHNGRRAFEAGEPLSANPYLAREGDADSRFARWLAGWRDAERALDPARATARDNREAQREGIAAIAEREQAPAVAAVRETIRLEMNWSGAAGIIAAALENGTGAGKRAAREELARMAELADERNRLARATAAALEALDSNQSPHARLAAIRAALSI